MNNKEIEKCFLTYVDGYLTCSYNHKAGEDCLMNKERKEEQMNNKGTDQVCAKCGTVWASNIKFELLKDAFIKVLCRKCGNLISIKVNKTNE